MSTEDRTALALRGRIGAYVTLSRHDPRVITAPARAAFLARFEREVDASDPEGKLDPVERARRVAYMRRLYFARLAYRSHVVRAQRLAERRRAKRPWLVDPELWAPEESGDVR